MNRRSFIDFIGKGLIISPAVPSILSSCTSEGEYLTEVIKGINPQAVDELVLAEGLSYEVLIKWRDNFGDNLRFGYNNDYIAYLPTGKNEGLLWVNHESVIPKLSSGYDPESARLRTQIDLEKQDVGGSIFKVVNRGGWQVVIGDESNDRLTATDSIPFEWPERVAGKSSAQGTLANCSGGTTPWGTVLTCEENYDFFYGERLFPSQQYVSSELQWESFSPRNKPEHYGWVVEYDPKTKSAKKHVALGRFAHECATVQELSDGRVVIYSGDDKNGGCLYKYISDEPGKVSPGKLYVGNFQSASWEHISYERPELQSRYSSETEMLIQARDAGLQVGGTPLDRPEDIEIDPIDGTVIVALTKNIPEENFFGSMMKLEELEGYDGMTFSYETMLTGGEDTGFACPDNMVFDGSGNLWFTSDISGSALNLPPYNKFGNNGLFVVPREGVNAGNVIQIASAPNDAEFTGPCFGPDGTLFLSVQHPGETSPDLGSLTSSWPEGPGNIPKPAVVAIRGDLIDDLASL